MSALLAASFTGCRPNRDGNQTAQGVQHSGQVLQSLSNMEMLRVAIRQHHKETGDWPDSLEEVKNRVVGYRALMNNPVTGDNPGYEYVKPTANWSPRTVIIYQLRNGQRDTSISSKSIGG